VRCDVINVREGGQIRHIFFDTGRNQLIAFIEALGVPGVPAAYDAGINRGLGVPNAFYHFAFEAGSETGLDEKRKELLVKGVEVTDVVDHNGPSRSTSRIPTTSSSSTAASRAISTRMTRRFRTASRSPCATWGSMTRARSPQPNGPLSEQEDVSIGARQ
jgi:hypothetical protein